jgi:hypothetical protein
MRSQGSQIKQNLSKMCNLASKDCENQAFFNGFSKETRMTGTAATPADENARQEYDHGGGRGRLSD